MSNVRLIPQIYFPGNNTTFGIQQVLNKLRQSANEVLSYIQTSSSGGATFGVGCYECNIGHNNGNGMLMLNGSKYFLRSNHMYDNPTGTGGFGNNNYILQDGGALDPSNSEYPA